MDRVKFEQLVFPLSEKEQLYRNHPEESLAHYTEPTSRVIRDSNGTIHFPSIGRQSQRSPTHAVIASKVTSIAQTNCITFHKQTRFSQVPLHCHDYIEMNYVYAGQCTSIINGQRVAMEQGDVTILDSGVVHTILPTDENDIILNCLMDQKYFTGSFLERMASEGPIPRFLSTAISENQDHNHYLLLHTAHRPLFHEIIENIFCEYLDPTLCSTVAIDSYMNLLFIELVRCYQGAKEREYHAARKRYITEILRYMDDNCIHCTLEQTAAHFGYHPNYLSRMLREATGCNFKDLIADGRLSRVAFLLRNSDAPISRIAQENGYLNQNFFYSKFTSRYGCTPGEYRNEKRE